MGDRRSNRKLGSHKVTITHTPPSKSKVRPPRESNSRPRGHFFRKGLLMAPPRWSRSCSRTPRAKQHSFASVTVHVGSLRAGPRAALIRGHLLSPNTFQRFQFPACHEVKSTSTEKMTPRSGVRFSGRSNFRLRGWSVGNSHFVTAQLLIASAITHPSLSLVVSK